jgi:AraC family transcriptional regulator of adaptative response/methylated-DNA-[protein]-cysteine methyltransferase
METNGVLRLRFGTGDTPVGAIFVVVSDRGLCALRLLEGRTAESVLRELKREHPQATWVEDRAGVLPVVEQINEVLHGRLPAEHVQLDMRGTAFQQRVWRELMRVPRGQTWSYSELARRAGRPKAVRAAASACARNPVALLVPCHRIIAADGSLGGYGYGLKRKRQILQWEADH